MEATKCPKCGEEPAFIEHIEKWYCYGCNSYIDEDGDRLACVDNHAQGDQASTLSEELKSLDDIDKRLVCKSCGAELEDLKDGRLYCFVCETYQDEIDETKEGHGPNEAQLLLDSASAPAVEKAPEPAQPVPELKPEMPAVAPAPAKEPEPKPADVRTCPSCKQPLKYIDKYQRHYCYGCRKYAPKDEAPKPSSAEVEGDVHSKRCPDCSGELKFIERYKEYYCYACKKYPLRPHKGPEPAKVVSKPKANSCPKCGEPLRWIDKYSRYYCMRCKEYAPKGLGGVPSGATEKKNCPTCKEPMKFVSEYNEWYCFKCKKYSLRPNKPALLF